MRCIKIPEFEWRDDSSFKCLASGWRACIKRAYTCAGVAYAGGGSGRGLSSADLLVRDLDESSTEEDASKNVTATGEVKGEWQMSLPEGSSLGDVMEDLRVLEKIIRTAQQVRTCIPSFGSACNLPWLTVWYVLLGIITQNECGRSKGLKEFCFETFLSAPLMLYFGNFFNPTFCW